jgi:hypothetical protein
VSFFITSREFALCICISGARAAEARCGIGRETQSVNDTLVLGYSSIKVLILEKKKRQK